MRGSADGLPTPFPIAGVLPSILREDDFLCRFTESLDAVWAPLFFALDCLDAYVDPSLTPEDFLPWLAGWVGVELDDNWPLERRRMLVREIVGLYRQRGTAVGIRRLVEIYTGVDPEIVETGAVSASEVPGAPLPGSAPAELVVRLRVEDPETFDVHRLDHLVAQAKPAHVPHRIEVARA
jgi:phage tail-like protein